MNAAVTVAAPNPFKSVYGHFINGQWVDSTSGETIAQYNPATGEIISRIQSGNKEDVDRAVRAARAAFPAWSRSTAEQRQELLLEIARRLKRRHADFALMESLNNGKTLGEAMFLDVPQAWGQFELFAGAAYGLHGETRDYPNAIGLVHREALGVVAQIIPWNVPLAMASMKLAPALAAGNTIALKPAETVCLSVLELMMEIAQILPPGVINVITGYGQNVGEALVTPTRKYARWLSPARPLRRARSSSTPRTTSFLKPWNWVANPPTSFARTRTWTPPRRQRRCPPSLTRARCAWPARACSFSAR
jgi:delta 1-pyrroline-5-carboxylate dehydrogenase